MRKFFSLFLALSLALLMYGPMAMASDTPSIETYVLVNNAARGIVTNISTSTIRPGKDRILAWEVTTYDVSTSAVSCAFFDTASVAVTTLGTYATTTYLLGETVGSYQAPTYREPPKPISFSTALSVYQSPESIVTIYYEKTTP